MDPLKVTPPQETKLHFLDYWRIIRIRKTVIMAVFLLVVITATLVTFILPESYLEHRPHQGRARPGGHRRPPHGHLAHDL